jgi:hypothetical protein
MERNHVTTKCYYEHSSAAADRFACFDGENIVCPRCCLESCPSEEPDWFAQCQAAGRPTWPPTMRKLASQEASSPEAGIAHKLVCLETYWDDSEARLFSSTSVRSFLDGLSSLFDPQIRLAHRFVESMAQLSSYTARPDGLLWQDEDVYDTPVYYLSFHGSPGTVYSALDELGTKSLCQAFAGWGQKHTNLIYFGACSVFAGRTGRKFARDFLAASGCHAIIGYTTDVDWMDSLLTDLLFLYRFYSDTDPWGHIRSIHKSVLADYAPAQQLGYELHMPD